MDESSNFLKKTKNESPYKEDKEDKENAYNEKVIRISILILNLSLIIIFFLYNKNIISKNDNNLEKFFPRYDDKSEEITILDKFYKFSENGTLLSNIF